MLSCKEATRLASEALDRPLPLRSRLGLRMHLLMCSGCRAVSRQLGALQQLLRLRLANGQDSHAAPSVSDPLARDRVREAVHKALDQKDGSASGSGSGGGGGGTDGL